MFVTRPNNYYGKNYINLTGKTIKIDNEIETYIFRTCEEYKEGDNVPRKQNTYYITPPGYQLRNYREDFLTYSFKHEFENLDINKDIIIIDCLRKFCSPTGHSTELVSHYIGV